MNKKRSIVALLACMAFVVALAGLAACSQPQQSSNSEEKLEVAEVKQETIETDPFYVLVVGNDTRKGTAGISEPAYADGSARSDTMMLTRVDPAKHQVTFVTIPRDTQDTYDGSNVKINMRYQYGGINELLKAVEELTGVAPKYYVDTTFVGFQDLVNKLGGIHMNVPFDQSMVDIVSGEKMSFPAGEQDLNGAQALIYARERHKYDKMGYTNQEAYRQSADRKILETIVKTVFSNPSTAVSMTESLYGYVDTNWPLDNLKLYVQDFADHANEITYLGGTGPFTGDIDASSQLWMTFRDPETWAKIIEVVNAGGDPNTVLPAPSIAG